MSQTEIGKLLGLGLADTVPSTSNGPPPGPSHKQTKVWQPVGPRPKRPVMHKSHVNRVGPENTWSKLLIKKKKLPGPSHYPLLGPKF